MHLTKHTFEIPWLHNTTIYRKNQQYFRTHVCTTICFYQLNNFLTDFLRRFKESSEFSDTYLYGESKRSVIRTFRPDASCSNVSSRGDFPFMISLIVDFGIPVMSDTCRTDRFLSYIISLSNIFMWILSADIIQIYKFGYNRKSVYIWCKVRN